MLFLLCVSPHELMAQRGWTKKQLGDFDSRLKKNCAYTVPCCDCYFQELTQAMSAKDISNPGMREKINKILAFCQIKHESFPKQKKEPDLQITNVSLKDEKQPESGRIRYDSEGTLLIKVENKPDRSKQGFTSVKNKNDRIGYGCTVEITHDIKGLTFDQNKKDLGNILWGGEKEIKFKYSTDTTLTDLTRKPITIKTYDHNNVSADINILNTVINGFKAPNLSVTTVPVYIGNTWSITLTPVNLGFGADEDVIVSWKALSGLILTDEMTSEKYEKLEPKKRVNGIPVRCSQINYEGIAEIEVTISGKYTPPITTTRKFKLNPKTPSVTSKNIGEINRVSYQVSDVDEFKIKNRKPNKTAIGFVIGVNDYDDSKIPNLPFAQNDAKVVNDYFIRMIGIPEKNMIYRQDATKSQIIEALEEVDEIKEIIELTEKTDDIDIYFYFSGHGSSNMKQEQLLIPSDISQKNSIKNGLRLQEDVMNELARNTSGKIIGFIDACYSKITERSKGLGIKELGNLSERVVVFSAVSGNQLAYGKPGENHSQFTYELLSLLKANKGNILLGDLEAQLVENVYNSSKRVQKPNVQAPNTDYKTWKLLKD